MKTIVAFDVAIDNEKRSVVRERLLQFLTGKTPRHIVTINAEFLLEAQKNKRFRDVLKSADLSVPDSVSMHLVAWHSGTLLQARYPGIDLMHDMLALAQTRGDGVFLLASTIGLSTWEETAQAIHKDFPTLTIHGINLAPTTKKIDNIVATISKHGSAIVLCNFGAPQQDLFLSALKNATIPSVRILMGVGGSYDFITGKQKRAPHWMRHMGLEWLYRLWQQPRRFGRIVNAVVIFPLKLLFTTNHHGHT